MSRFQLMIGLLITVLTICFGLFACTSTKEKPPIEASTSEAVAEERKNEQQEAVRSTVATAN